jgi:murein L,D-transpeptidase YcbB/YkuD
VAHKAPAGVVKKPLAQQATKTNSRPAYAPSKAGVHAPTQKMSTATTTRGRVQPTQQWSRYSNTSRGRQRQYATSRTPVRSRPAYHPPQAQPTSDRYKEIQAALVQKGYLHSEPSGVWDAESIDAMKRFQKEQNLDADGKLSSLSLIGLGLGPKRAVTASSVSPQAAPGVVPASSLVPPKS